METYLVHFTELGLHFTELGLHFTELGLQICFLVSGVLTVHKL